MPERPVGTLGADRGAAVDCKVLTASACLSAVGGLRSAGMEIERQKFQVNDGCVTGAYMRFVQSGLRAADGQGRRRRTEGAEGNERVNQITPASEHNK